MSARRPNLFEQLVRPLLREPAGTLTLTWDHAEARAVFSAPGIDRPLVSLVALRPPAEPGDERQVALFDEAPASRPAPAPEAPAAPPAAPPAKASKTAKVSRPKALPRPEKGAVLVFRDEDYWGHGGRKGLAGLPPFTPMKGGLGSTTGGTCRPHTYVGPVDPADPRLAAALAAAAKAGVTPRRIDDADLSLAQNIIGAERLGAGKPATESKARPRPAKAREHAAKGGPPRALDARSEGGPS